MTVLKHWRDIPLTDPRVEAVADALIQESKSLTDSPQTWRAAQIAVAALADLHQVAVEEAHAVATALRELGEEYRNEYPDGRVAKADMKKMANRLDAIEGTEKRDDKIGPCRDETG
jgi:hypothetical protein